jgi:hypothetical protein
MTMKLWTDLKQAPGIGLLALLLLCTAAIAAGTANYPSMAPIAQYLSASQADEIALARSAAPAAISKDAEILVLSPKGYATAVAGKNHFVCMVERSWAKNFDGADFWNPKVRAPHCFNPAAHSVLSAYLKRTEWVLAGVSAKDMATRTQAAIASHELPPPAVGAMAYMMSKDGYLGDDVHGAWHPHLMFYLPRTKLGVWGANLKDSPISGDDSWPEPVTVFFIPVEHWSDGTSAEMAEH